MAKKPTSKTVGEKIVSEMILAQVHLNEEGEKMVARQIDSAIRRAVKEAYCAGVKDGYNNNVNQIALAAKYRVRL
jgi:hypothetical protein